MQTFIVNLLAVVPMMLISVFSMRVFGTWSSPPVFFTIYWTTVSLSTLLFTPREYISVAAVLYIVFATTSLNSGSIIGYVLAQRMVNQASLQFNRVQRIGALRTVLGASVTLGIVSGMLAISEAGYTLADLLSVSSLVRMANQFSVARYTDGYVPSVQSQLLRVFVFLSPLVSGSLVALSRRRVDRLLAYSSIFPAILITVVQTQRGVTILSLILFTSAFISVNLGIRGEMKLKLSYVIGGVAILPIMFVFFALVAVFRAGWQDLTNVTLLFPKVFSNIFGQIPAFSYWFDATMLVQGRSGLGRYTFAGIYDFLGVAERSLGLFQEFIQLRSGYVTNIYTVFRPLIEDFGLVGSMFVLLGIGFMFVIIFVQVTSGNLALIPLLTAYYSFVLMSFNTSIWVWNTVLAAFVCYTGIWLVLLGRSTAVARTTYRPVVLASVTRPRTDQPL